MSYEQYSSMINLAMNILAKINTNNLFLEKKK